MNVLEFCREVVAPHLPILRAESWRPWKVALAALFGLPMDGADLELYRACTGRASPPAAPVREGWFIVGRRGGKSFIMALVAVFLSTVRKYDLAPGERGVFMVLASDRRQARVVRRYIGALFDNVPMLHQLVAHQTKESIQLSNGVDIEIHTSSFRSVRGYSVIGAVLDEIAFWPAEDSANPDAEILAALRPAMATTGGMLLAISTPHARRGELWSAYQRYYGEDGADSDTLVWVADTLTMNSTVPASVIRSAFTRDPKAAMAEYGKDGKVAFRSDVAALLSEQAIQAVVPKGVRELGPTDRRKARAHFDAATGSGSDAAALAIAYEGRPAELALIRQWKPPFSPRSVIEEAARICQEYGTQRVGIDRYAPGLVQQFFRDAGVFANPIKSDTSTNFLDLLAAINSERVRLLDHPVLLAELRRLERRPGSGDREKIGHAPGAHDDVAAAAAGALEGTFRKRKTQVTWGRDEPVRFRSRTVNIFPKPGEPKYEYWEGEPWR